MRKTIAKIAKLLTVIAGLTLSTELLESDTRIAGYTGCTSFSSATTSDIGGAPIAGPIVADRPAPASPATEGLEAKMSFLSESTIADESEGVWKRIDDELDHAERVVGGIAAAMLAGEAARNYLADLRDAVAQFEPLLPLVSSANYEALNDIASTLARLRTRLLDQSTTYAEWSRIAELIEPDVDSYDIPRRFVDPIPERTFSDDWQDPHEIYPMLDRIIGRA